MKKKETKSAPKEEIKSHNKSFKQKEKPALKGKK